MTGKAYTVVDGSGRIEQFDVRIIGLTDDGKGSKRMIMAEAFGWAFIGMGTLGTSVAKEITASGRF